ncbi:MAG: hypothetical protein AMJ43_03030 [Coxiella sp. DG_40]|nr:MAG: hypothetical protein AMJ43_03030 [Coxiella sp. DG_40]
MFPLFKRTKANVSCDNNAVKETGNWIRKGDGKRIPYLLDLIAVLSNNQISIQPKGEQQKQKNCDTLERLFRIAQSCTGHDGIPRLDITIERGKEHALTVRINTEEDDSNVMTIQGAMELFVQRNIMSEQTKNRALDLFEVHKISSVATAIEATSLMGGCCSR